MKLGAGTAVPCLYKDRKNPPDALREAPLEPRGKQGKQNSGCYIRQSKMAR